MAEKKPMSLNERHKHHLLSSQSRSVARPEEMKPNLQKVKVEGRRRLCKAVANDEATMNVNLDEPNFSGIMDFDSPSPSVSKSVGVKDRAAIDAPSFGGIMDFDSPLTKIIEDRPNSAQRSGFKHLSNKEETVGARDSDSAAFDAPSFGGIMDFDTPVKNAEDYESTSSERLNEKEEAISGSTSEYEEADEFHGDSSVHLIVSSNSQDYVSGNASEFEEAEEDRGDQTQEKEVERDSGVHFVMSSNSQEEEKPRKIKLEGRRRLCKVEPKEDKDREITCLDTPLAFDESTFKGVVDLDSPPEKIRDILDDLSSKLEFMSIEKKKTVNKVEKVPDSALSKLMEHYDSPGLSFSVSPDLAVKHKTQIVEKEVKGDEVFSFSAKYSTQVEEKKPKGDRGNSFSAKYSSQIAEKDAKGDRLFNFAAKDKTQTAKEEREDDKFFYRVDYAKKADHVKMTERDYGVKKTEKSVSRESFTVVSDDDEDPYMFLSNANSSRKPSSRRTNCLKEDAKDSVFGTPKDSAGGDWVFEDGESIILTGKPSNYNLPGKIAKMLYPHQRSGLRWLWSLHCKGTGGILGDDMGLGKTMQICSFLAGLFHSRLVKRILVVAPKTLLTHWIKELTVVGLSEKIREYYGTCAKARQYELQYIFQDSGILLTTYDIVRNNYKSLRGDSYFLDDSGEDLITWDYIILDEGHIIKNPSTQRAKSLLEIPSDHRIIISGTPIQNNLKELWALFSFCCPELLGDKKEFKLKYESPILRGNEKNATDREKRIGSAVAKEFRERIEPYFLRRLKSEVFLEDDQTKSSQISKKNELIVWLRLTQSQRQLYEAFLNSELVLSSFDGSPLAALTVLKKICDHPYLLTKRAAEDVLEGMEAMVNQDELGILERMALHLANASDSENFQDLIDNVSCKIAFILSLLDNLIPDGHNVLIFSQTRKMLNFVQEAIISRGYKFLRIDGTTKISDREKIVKDFQEGEGAPIFLLTSQVGGLGLTLTKADRVIVVDPAWNPSTDNQSVDRAYRIGQKKDVIVYRLMTCGTIEEKIYKMQVFKGGLFKTATEHKEQTRYFSQQDLRELFSLPKEGFDVSVTQRQLAEEHDQQHIMDVSLKKHIEFLESHDISGVSHHSLLFSKTAPTPPLEEQEVARRKESTFVGSSSSSASVERIVDGAAFAFNPKEVKARSKCTIDVSPNKSTESEIRDRLERLHQMYANKGMISKLPDKGEKLKRQIADLSFELEKISMPQDSVTEIVDLDEISGKLQRVHV